MALTLFHIYGWLAGWAGWAGLYRLEKAMKTEEYLDSLRVNFTGQLLEAFAKARASVDVNTDQGPWELASINVIEGAVAFAPVGANTAAGVRFLLRKVDNGYYEVSRQDLWDQYGVEQDDLRGLQLVASFL